VAFAVSDGTVMIDLAGPWEVFTDVMIPSRGTSIGVGQEPLTIWLKRLRGKPEPKIERRGGGRIKLPTYETMSRLL
jgi:hypothetical protein